jgi:hypothetical protein
MLPLTPLHTAWRHRGALALVTLLAAGTPALASAQALCKRDTIFGNYVPMVPQRIDTDAGVFSPALPVSFHWSPSSQVTQARVAVRNYNYVENVLGVMVDPAGYTGYVDNSASSPLPLPTGWLTVGSGGMIGAGETMNSAMTITANLNPRLVAGERHSGTYYGTVVYWSEAAPTSCGRLTVVYTITWPEIWASSPLPTRVQRNQPIRVQQHALTVGNPTTAPLTNLTITATTDSAGVSTGENAGPRAWLRVPADGPHDVGAKSSAAFAYEIDATGLPNGHYVRFLSLQSTNALRPQYVRVELDVVGEPAAIAFSQDSLLLSTTVNAITAPRSGWVRVRERTGGRVDSLALGGVQYEGERTGWLTPTLSKQHPEIEQMLPFPFSSPADLDVAALTRGFKAGAYRATVKVVGTGLPGILPVWLEVVDLKLSQAAVTDATKLPAAERERLDALGNANGTYDLGDYLALRERLRLP